MTEVLDDTRQTLAARMNELKPLVDEFHRLEAAQAAFDTALAGIKKPAKAPTARKRRGNGHTQESKAVVKERTGSGRGRPKGTGKRGAEALEILRTNPGLTIREIAERMGIKQNYLYRLLPELAAEGRVEKRGKHWFPNEPAFMAGSVDVAH